MTNNINYEVEYKKLLLQVAATAKQLREMRVQRILITLSKKKVKDRKIKDLEFKLTTFIVMGCNHHEMDELLEHMECVC